MCFCHDVEISNIFLTKNSLLFSIYTHKWKAINNLFKRHIISISARFICHCQAWITDLIWDDCFVHNEIKINMYEYFRIGREKVLKTFSHFMKQKLFSSIDSFDRSTRKRVWNVWVNVCVWVCKLNFELFYSKFSVRSFLRGYFRIFNNKISFKLQKKY